MNFAYKDSIALGLLFCLHSCDIVIGTAINRAFVNYKQVRRSNGKKVNADGNAIRVSMSHIRVEPVCESVYLMKYL